MVNSDRWLGVRCRRQAAIPVQARPLLWLLRFDTDMIMRLEDLRTLYLQLRHALEAAYAQRPWDGRRIDRIALQLLELERSLAACQSAVRRRAALRR
jgi:hypothetical protein